MKDIDLSITMPVYNVRKYLCQSVDSVLQSEWGDLAYELIIIDDGSTDGSKEILCQYKAHPNIRIVRQKNQGLVAAREAAMGLARGRYVTFLDSDDWVSPDYFPTLLRFCVDQGLDIGIGNFQLAFQDTEMPLFSSDEMRFLSREEAMAELFAWHYFRWELCSKIYRREIIQDICIDPAIRSGEDCLRNFFAFQRAEHVGILPLQGFHYRQRASSMTKGGQELSYTSLVSYVLEQAGAQREHMTETVWQAFLDRKLHFAIADLCQTALSQEARERLYEQIRFVEGELGKSVFALQSLPKSMKMKYVVSYMPEMLRAAAYKLYHALRGGKNKRILYD